jgi:hypothetical protein
MNPYAKLPPDAFWRSGVADRSPLHLDSIYAPRFPIGKTDPIAAAGSCFAQHIGRQFKARGYNFLDIEPAPIALPAHRHAEFGFGLYSARYGNVYTVRQLLQLFNRASGTFRPQETCWEKDGRYFDPFRPAIETYGFMSRAELEADCRAHLSALSLLLPQTSVFVFTFGLTEAWECIADGAALPTCPGTVAGAFDPERYAFVNFDYPEILADAEAFIALALAANPAMRFLLTVSPVPLTATMSGDHVLAATVHSKSVLRAVCGTLRRKYACVDYFPSYELAASHPTRAMFFEPNLRTVAPRGVAHIMQTFFAAHGEVTAPSATKAEPHPDDVTCEEEFLERFAR